MMRVLDFVVDLFWLRVPLLVRRVSGTLGETLVDGQYLLAWRPLAAAAPPLALLLGFWIGWTHWGYLGVFTESLTLMRLAVVVGVASTYLGALFVLGFAAGDYLLLSTPGHLALLAERQGGVNFHIPMMRLGLLVEYGLLALLVVSVPLGARALMAQLRLPRIATRYAAGRLVHVLVFAVGFPALVGVLTYLWQQSAPLLIRPVFTFGNRQPLTQAIYPLQQTGLALAHAAMAAALARIALEGISLSSEGARQRIGRLHARLGAGAQRITPLMERVNPWVPAVLGAAWATLMLSGPVESRFWQYLLFGVILALAALRAGLLPLPLGPWPRVAARIPLLLRMGATMAIVYVISQNVILGRRPEGLGNLRVFVFITIVALVVSFLFNPGLHEARARRRKAAVGKDEAGASSPSPVVASAASLIALLVPALGAALMGTLLFPDLALADNCSNDTDCFGTARGMVAPAVATGAMALFLSGARRWLDRGVSAALHLNPVTGPMMWGYGFVTGKDFWTGERTYFDLEWAKNVPEAFWEDYASGQALKRLEAFTKALPEGVKQGYDGTIKSLETAGKFWADVSGDPGKLADAMEAMPDAAVGAANDMVRLGRELEAAATAQDTTRFGELMGQMTGNAMFQAVLAKGQGMAMEGAGRGLSVMRGPKPGPGDVMDGVPNRPITPTMPRPEMPAIRPTPAAPTAPPVRPAAPPVRPAPAGALDEMVGPRPTIEPPRRPAAPPAAPPAPPAPAQPPGGFAKPPTQLTPPPPHPGPLPKPAAPAAPSAPPKPVGAQRATDLPAVGQRITPERAAQNILDAHGDVIPPSRQPHIDASRTRLVDDNQFADAYKAAGGDPKDLNRALGFVDRTDPDKPVSVVRQNQPDGQVQHATQHEMMHTAQNPAFKQELGKPMNEAATEFFTRELSEASGLQPKSAYLSDGRVGIIDELAKTAGRDAVRAAYFGEGKAPIDALKHAVGSDNFKAAVGLAEHGLFREAADLLARAARRGF